MNFDVLLSAAEGGDTESQAKLSLEYLAGNLVAQNFDDGCKWLAKAAADRTVTDSIINPDKLQPYPEASLHVSTAYRSIVSPTDIKWANLFLINAAKGGVVNAAFQLGIECSGPGIDVPSEYRGHKYAIYWFQKALEGDHPQAHRYLYARYKDENYPETVDHEKAFYHVSKIVENGSYNECAAIGRMYAAGKGTEKNLLMAFQWLYIAACTVTKGAIWDELKAVHAQLSESEYDTANTTTLEWIRKNALNSKMKTQRGLVDPISGDALQLEFEDAQAQGDKNTKSSVQKETTAEKEALISLWHQYCTGASDIDFDRFHTLLFEDPKLTDEQLNNIFQYYLHKDELIRRFKSVCDMKFHRSSSTFTAIELEQFVRQDLEIRLNLCRTIDDHEVVEQLDGIDSALINNTKLRLTKVKEEFESAANADTASGRLYDILYDDLDTFFDTSEMVGVLGLQEALTALFADPILVAYVLTPYATRDIDFEPYLNTLKAGAKYVLTFDELVIYVDPRRKLG